MERIPVRQPRDKPPTPKGRDRLDLCDTTVLALDLSSDAETTEDGATSAKSWKTGPQLGMKTVHYGAKYKRLNPEEITRDVLVRNNLTLEVAAVCLGRAGAG